MGPSANFPRAFAGKDYTATNDTNISAGRSSWKFGVRVNRAEQFVQQAFSRGGQASFANVTAFLQGLPNFTRAPSPGSSNSKTLTYTSIGVYAQDDFKVSDRLTLNLGVRVYEPQTRYKEKFGRESAIRNILTDAEATLGPMFRNNTLDDISPRLGFAWDVLRKRQDRRARRGRASLRPGQHGDAAGAGGRGNPSVLVAQPRRQRALHRTVRVASRRVAASASNQRLRPGSTQYVALQRRRGAGAVRQHGADGGLRGLTRDQSDQDGGG